MVEGSGGASQQPPSEVFVPSAVETPGYQRKRPETFAPLLSSEVVSEEALTPGQPREARMVDIQALMEEVLREQRAAAADRWILADEGGSPLNERN